MEKVVTRVQDKILLKGAGSAPIDLEAYHLQGGYQALQKVVRDLSPEDIIREVLQAGLKGRGGAGFPTGKKWALAAQKKGPKKYVCCNASEGEPGTYKDRLLMRSNPHQLLEGVAIAAIAIGADEAYIFLKQKFLREYDILCRAVEEATRAGYLGDLILGSSFNLRIHIFQGPDLYIAGEETAMLEAIEGRPAQPKQKPPFYPIQHGLFGKPTLVNNAETLCSVPHIIRRGAQWFSRVGDPKSAGTMLFSVTGEVNHPGIFELPLGTPLRELIFDCAGGMRDGRRFKAVFPGGPSQRLLLEEDLDTPLEYEAMKQRGSGLGTGAIIVLSEQICMVHVALYFARFFMRETCGQCPPCKLGTIHMVQLLEKIEQGKGSLKDLGALEQIFKLIWGRGYCDLINSSVRSVESTLTHFRSEYEEHIQEQSCRFQDKGDFTALLEPEGLLTGGKGSTWEAHS